MEKNPMRVKCLDLRSKPATSCIQLPIPEMHPRLLKTMTFLEGLVPNRLGSECLSSSQKVVSVKMCMATVVDLKVEVSNGVIETR